MKIGSINLPNPNAVLFKDMQQKTKRVKLALSVFLCNLLLAIIALIVLLVMAFEASTGEHIDYSTLSGLFIGLASTEAALLCLITPSLTAGCITMEREKQTFDVLLSTKLTPWQIIKGKYWASILQVLLLILSGLPVYSLVFIYGGVSFFQALGVLGVLMVIAMFIASLGVYSSAVRKKTIAANVLTYCLMILFFFGTVVIVLLATGIAEGINSTNRYNLGLYTNYTAGPFIFVLYLNPILLILDVFNRIFGIEVLGFHYGVPDLLSDITNFRSDLFLLKYWSIFSIILMLIVSYLFLRASARAIDPLRRRRVTHGFKTKTVKVHNDNPQAP